MLPTESIQNWLNGVRGVYKLFGASALVWIVSGYLVFEVIAPAEGGIMAILTVMGLFLTFLITTISTGVIGAFALISLIGDVANKLQDGNYRIPIRFIPKE